MLRRDLLRTAASAALLTPFAGMMPRVSGRAMAETASTDPFLSGGYAPVQDELTLDDLPVTGRIPAELNGVYRRNGPNPAFPPLSFTFPFDGDGMVHAVSLRDGRAGYRNRFVNTPELVAERKAGRALYGGIARPVMPDPALLPPGTPPGPIKNFANTNIVQHAGRLLALFEAGMPQELDAELRTKGSYDFAGQLSGSMTAHPFVDAVSGEMLFYRYRGRTAPFLTLYVADRSGRIVAQRDIDTGAPYMIHDFAVTRTRVVFVLTPVVFDFAGAREGRPLFAWKPGLGTRIAMLDRRDLAAPVTWRETEPYFQYHFLNAYDDRDATVIDYARYPKFGGFGRDNQPYLARLILAGGAVEHVRAESPPVEFPRIDDRRRGLKHRIGFGAGFGGAVRGSLARFDRVAGTVALHDFGPAKEVGEPVFVPRHADAAEDDGWVMTFVYDRTADRSDFVLLDARDFSSPPTATIHLPRRVPHGIHGNWMAR